jgi:hypothetical protein
MTPKRSPGGSIFPYNYKGAEIFGHYATMPSKYGD